MKKSKVLILSLCAVLLAVVSVFGTMAYLTDQDSAVNVFTVGRVNITLDEAKVSPEGKPLDKDGNEVADISGADRVKGNKYHLIPGRTYVKDPTITVVKGSAETYVRMLVTINNLSELDLIFADNGGADLTAVFGGYNSEKWVYEGESKNTGDNSITYEFRYAQTVKAGSDEDIVLEPLFTSITVPEEITREQLATIKDLEITVVGHAIQEAGFDSDDDAWAAFTAQTDK